MEKRIHVRDLAPFASSEDLSDERESPLDEEKQKNKLPHIEEEMKESSKTNLTVTNVAPRIDISRASSSSHQEDSSPERELVLGENGKGSKLEVAFGEEIASDLHSSTEELSFQDPAEAEKYKKKKQSQTFSDLQNDTLRKDSGCSDIALLSISGRTSRVSSVGSVASGGSGVSNYSAVSHCSARSHLSATSNLSKASRGSSPHRMSLETSFCGPKPVHSVSLDVDETVKSIADKLSNKTEQVETTVKDSINEKSTPKSKKVSLRDASKRSSDSKGSHSRDRSRSGRRKPPIENPKTQKFVSLHSDEEEEPIASKSVSKSVNTKANPAIDNRTQIFIPLHGDSDENEKICEPNPNSPKRLKPFTNTTLVNFISKYDTEGNTKRERRSTVSETKSDYHGTREINEEFQKFISLKDDDDDGSGRVQCTPKHRRSVCSIAISETKPANQIVVPIQVYQVPTTTETAPSPEKPTSDLPKYLMTDDGTTQYIPLRGSDSLLQTRQSNSNKNNYLSVNKNEIKSLSDDRNLSHLSPLISPNLGRHNKPSNLELSYREHPTRSAKSMTQLINRDESRTPSPNASASNHNRLYRRCSESAKEIRNIEKPKSRSGSIKSLFSSFFKRSGSARTKKTQKADTSRNEVSDPKITNAEFTFRQPAKSTEPDTIIIPLHSDDELTPSKVKCYGDDPKKELKKEKSNTSENKTNIPDKVIEKSIPSTSSSPKTKTVSYAENFQKKNGTESGKSDTHITRKKETVKEIRIIEKTCVLSSPEVEKKIEIYKLECEVTVHNEASTPTKSQPDIQKNAEKKHEVPSNVYDEKESPLNDDTDANRIKVDSEESDTAENHKKMSKHEDGEEGDISTDSDRVTLVVAECEENKTLVNTSESFEEELPYVPTTLPLERSVAMPIVPIKERVIEIRTQSVDRPRSVTPLNPALLDSYVSTSLPPTVTNADETSTTEKLHITLPRADAAADVPKKKSPLIKKKTWQNFIEHDLQSPKRVPKTDTVDNSESPPPTLQQRKSMSWVSFDESSHEMRQSPKRITTLPSSYGVDNSVADAKEINYGQRVVFVNPEECSCECHETQHGIKSFQKQ